MSRAVWPGERRKRIRDNLIAVGFAILAFLFMLFVLVNSAIAHENGAPNWITEGGYKGTDNVHCCGPGDCFPIAFEDVRVTTQGYVLKTYGNEIVPFAETAPSEDRRIWRCKAGDGRRRCFFAPIGGA